MVNGQLNNINESSDHFTLRKLLTKKKFYNHKMNAKNKEKRFCKKKLKRYSKSKFLIVHELFDFIC